MSIYGGCFPEYVPVLVQRDRAAEKVAKMKKRGEISIMKTKNKLPIAAALIMATATLTNAMENTVLQQDHHTGIVGQNTTASIELTPIKFTLPNDILRHFVLECPAKNRIRMRSVNIFTRDAVDKAHEVGKYLEELVFELVIQNNIYMPLHKLDEPEYFENNGMKMRDFVESWGSVKKIPQSIEELRDWCEKGYPFGKGESVSPFNEGYSTKFYSFWLFHHGVQSNCLPLVRYVLDQHNNFWDPQTKVKSILRSPKGEIFHTHLTYIIDKDFVDIFDFVMKNKEFREFSFGDCLLEYYGTDHILIKDINITRIFEHGSKAIIAHLFQDQHFLQACLSAEKSKSEGKLNPLVKAVQDLGRPKEIIDVVEEAIKNTLTEAQAMVAELAEIKELNTI